MTIFAILLGTVAAGVGSVWLAAMLSLGVLARYTQHMLSLAAGALLATAFMHLLPEAFESEAGAHDLFMWVLAGLVFFFLLDKAELWHHGHEHHHDPEAAPSTPSDHDGHGHSHHHAHGHDHPGHDHGPRTGGWTVLLGDSVHAFGDGILIASAFLADMRLGVITSLAVLAHEVPHHMGDLVVLRHTSGTRRSAIVKVSMAGTVTAVGGLVGYAVVGELQDYLPYFLVVASSSFVYVALADLIPQLQKRLTLSETVAQLAWLGVGIIMVTVVSGLAHSH
jgi:zinc and cadmium transporter